MMSSGRMPRCSATSISFRSLSRMRCSRLRIAALVDPGVCRQPARSPLTVIPAIAELALLCRERQQRRREPVPLGLGPAPLGLIQNGDSGISSSVTNVSAWPDAC